MPLLGIYVDSLLAAQVLAALVVIAVFSAYTVMQTDDASWLSDLQTATMLRLLFANHPTEQDVECVGLPDGERRRLDPTAVRSKLNAQLLGLITRKELAFAPQRDPAWMNALLAFGIATLAPLATATVVWTDLDNARKGLRVERFVATASRRVDLAGFTVAGVASVGYLVAALASTWNHWFVMTIGGVGLVGLVLSVACGAVLIAEQTRWKLYWRTHLGEAAICALDNGEDAAFANIMAAKYEVDVAPAVPLPAAIGFYAAVFTAAQLALPILARQVEWL